MLALLKRNFYYILEIVQGVSSPLLGALISFILYIIFSSKESNRCLGSAPQ